MSPVDRSVLRLPPPAGEPQPRDREYWLARAATLPPPPELPTVDPAVAAAHEQGAPEVRFERHRITLDRAEWAGLRERATRFGCAASTAVLTAYAEVIGAWSRRPGFTLSLTSFERDAAIVGLLAVDLDPQLPRRARANAVQIRRSADFEHRRFPAAQVAAEVARRHGPGAGRFPVAFSSAVEVDAGTGPSGPQRGTTASEDDWIACHARRSGDGLLVTWESRAGVFPPGLVGAMVGVFGSLLRELAGDDEAWLTAAPVRLPADQAQRRRAVNATTGPLPDALLHEEVVAQCARTPDAPAVIAADAVMSYRELLGRAAAMAQTLRDDGCGPGAVVAVAVEKSAAQVVAVFGALLAGAAYLPLDDGQPPARQNRIVAGAGARWVLVSARTAGGPWPHDVTTIAVDAAAPPDGAVPGPAPRPRVAPDDLAYVIYTSGSTGVPKGVEMSHRSALNTVADLNRRFAVGPADRVLGLTPLSFDLSVYDLFGPLAVGGCLVLPRPELRGDPAHWAQLAAQHRVTLWNSVPAQLRMLADHLEATRAPAPLDALRLAMLSGDWIPVSLPDRIRALLPELRLVSLGGATEAAIWSIWYPIEAVPAGWPSIPYGTPLDNQTCHVLDAGLAPRPDWVVGELFIGGAGLAIGYRGDPATTAHRFLRHPLTAERLYRTGDLARYHPDGVIELLGRDDAQVKIRGYRIEPAEVEAALAGHPAVREAVVATHPDAAGDPRLIAYWAPCTGTAADLPSASELRSHLQRIVPEYMVPSAFVALERLPLTANGKVDRRALPAPDGVRTDDEDIAAPQTAVEQAVAQIWAEALSVDRMGIDEDFFELGGHSMLATQVVAETQARLGVKASVRLVFDEPTIRGFARALEQQIPIRDSAPRERPDERLREAG